MGRIFDRARRIARQRLAGLLDDQRPLDEPRVEPRGEENWEPPPVVGAPDAHDEEQRRALSILELQPGATRSEIRSAYRALCRRYHPDHFANNADKLRQANALVSEINLAYARLTGDS